MSRDERQVNLIYAGSSQMGNKLEAYLESFEKKSLQIDIEKSMISQTQWAELSKVLNTSIKSFVDEKKIEQLDNCDNFSENDWIKVIENNPSSMLGAIVINGSKTKHIINISELFKYFGVDSAGLDKTMYVEEPTIQRTTKNDSFI